MKHKNIFWGIFFLAAAIFVIASQVDAFSHFGFWSILATVLLAAVFLSSLIDFNFFGIFLSAAFLYLIFQRSFDLYYIPFWQLILAAVFVSIGLSIIFHGHRHWKKCISRSFKNEYSKSEEKIDGNDIYIRSRFSESCRYLRADSLKKAQLSSSFGKLSVYFDQVQLCPEGADVFVDVSFGEMVIYLPKNWRVTNNVNASVGSVNDNSPNIPAEVNAPSLTLSGNVSFGQLIINYV